MCCLGPDQAELRLFIVRVAPTAPNTDDPNHRHKKFPIACRRSFRKARVGHAKECKDSAQPAYGSSLSQILARRQPLLRGCRGNS